MALVTFLSDFGTEDHYVAAVKATILRTNIDIKIVDISHNIVPSDIAHAAFVLKNVYHEFPEDTIHICAIDLCERKPSMPIGIKLDDQYFLGYDIGLFSLINNKQPTEKVKLTPPRNPLSIGELPPFHSTFVARDLFAPIAAQLAEGRSLSELGSPIDEIQRLIGRQLKTNPALIAGNVMRIDHYGNLITNIPKRDFDGVRKINGHKPFEISFGKEISKKIHSNYHEVDSGECFLFFNSNDYLQIGINKGNASELLGVKYDSPVTINFESQD